MEERRGRGNSRNMNRGFMGTNNRVGIDYESGGGQGRAMGKKCDNCN